MKCDILPYSFFFAGVFARKAKLFGGAGNVVSVPLLKRKRLGGPGEIRTRELLLFLNIAKEYIASFA